MLENKPCGFLKNINPLTCFRSKQNTLLAVVIVLWYSNCVHNLDNLTAKKCKRNIDGPYKVVDAPPTDVVVLWYYSNCDHNLDNLTAKKCNRNIDGPYKVIDAPPTDVVVLWYYSNCDHNLDNLTAKKCKRNIDGS